ncbi:hypothetical protein QYE76_022235 [Lolium multiflorum]|uniref:Uncharacterized protein n=1 Tax=Lolium multiflorum TaxID=4521 RepID=A0AAD8R814_LOLMU|nr:hypothetical protein QYE76_022235 [Lolium multiflorum]
MCYFYLQLWPTILGFDNFYYEAYSAPDFFSWKISWYKFPGAYVIVHQVLCPTRPHVHIPVSRPDDEDFSYVLVLGHKSIKIQRTRDALHLQQAKNFLQASSGSRFIEYSSLFACEMLDWKIEWPLYFVCSTSGNKSDKLFHPTKVSHQGTETEPKVRTATAPAYYRAICFDNSYYFDKVCADQDYYLEVCHLSLVKVCFDYSSHRDLSEVITHQVPWDPEIPGGATWHRLEVKPKFKEGGMLATYPTATTGLGLAATTGLGLLRRHGGTEYKY